MQRRSFRRAALALGVAWAVVAPAGANGETFSSCWVETQFNVVRGDYIDVTVCRVAGGETSEFPQGEVPSVLQPSVGTDADGACWFWTSLSTEWEILSTFSDGSAILGLTVNGFVALDTGRLPVCTSEPVEVDPPAVQAWEAITEYVHAPPEPELSPDVGAGVTGMETFAGIVVPQAWDDTLVSPGVTIDVEVTVASVEVDWGDGTADTFPPPAHDSLDGYPDGAATHVYEVKTCVDPASDPDCHPELTAYPITVAYHWAARWRSNGSAWIEVSVPPSETTVSYPVAEIVSVLTEVG